jgi:Fic family protein
MASIRKRKIGKKSYLYAEHSFRLPDKSIKKISKLVKEPSGLYGRETKDFFLEKETIANKEFSIKKYKTDSVFTEQELYKIEKARVGFREIKKKLTNKQWQDVLDRFTANFTYESNAIEGNSLTLKDVTLILGENIVPKNKDLREVYETKNTREVHEPLFNNKLSITKKHIIKIHSMLVKDTGVSFGFKKLPNYLVMRDLDTTPPEKVEEEIDNLIGWYDLNKEKLHPLKLATEFHARFEAIHPFEDGNGRTGRVLINAMLLERGYPPLIIRKTTRTAYFSALEAFDNGHRLKLERFLLEKLKETYNKFFGVYIKYI